MSDVTVAPQGSAPPAAPASNEVAINPNPTQTPNPVGAQVPQAPVGDLKGSEHRTPSRREAIQAAFDRANKSAVPARHAPKEAPKAAEAKPGHNNPPEPTEKFDLKKRPSNAPQSNGPQGDPPRDRGRFVSRETAAGTAAASQVASASSASNASNASVAKQLPANAPFRDPPARLADHAKAAWADTPEPVRGEVHRQQQEFAKAYQVYKGSFEEMKPIRRFAEMAKEHGTTLEAALTNYTGMEAKLRADPVAGLDQIVNNLNLKSADGQRIGLRDIAYHVLSQTPDQLRSIQHGNNLGAAAHQIQALHKEVSDLKGALQAMHTQQQFSYTRSAIDQFATSHPRLDELGDLVEQELKLGFDLDNAYRRAELLRPSTQAAQTRTPSAQTRSVDKSIHGSPDSASNGARRDRPRTASPTARDAVTNAINRLNGIH